mgnify:FL=1|tara:strand:+ start:298 stop:501 length:204 start_codon:yes stop_codon:yes gene_type:complete
MSSREEMYASFHKVMEKQKEEEEVYVSFVPSGEKKVLTVHRGNVLVIETELTEAKIRKLLRELVKIL